jgi:hypothetical protein
MAANIVMMDGDTDSWIAQRQALQAAGGRCGNVAAWFQNYFEDRRLDRTARR